jgi:hypothetical protein
MYMSWSQLIEGTQCASIVPAWAFSSVLQQSRACSFEPYPVGRERLHDRNPQKVGFGDHDVPSVFARKWCLQRRVLDTDSGKVEGLS